MADMGCYATKASGLFEHVKVVFLLVEACLNVKGVHHCRIRSASDAGRRVDSPAVGLLTLNASAAVRNADQEESDF